jgi:hypothetical protein
MASKKKETTTAKAYCSRAEAYADCRYDYVAEVICPHCKKKIYVGGWL